MFSSKREQYVQGLGAESSLLYFKEPQVILNDCSEGVWGGWVGGSEVCVEVGEQR